MDQKINLNTKGAAALLKADYFPFSPGTLKAFIGKTTLRLGSRGGRANASLPGTAVWPQIDER
ncbi:MAG: hypothetical protein WC829_13350 [Hyphomicrobium sp.]|jgi:hypothetical protein